MYENQERYEKIFEELDIARSKTGVIPMDDFKRIVADDSFLSFLQTDDIKELCEKHEEDRNGFDYRTFLTGKKYLTKPYLMAAFAEKKSRVKKVKKAKKQKVPLPSKVIIYVNIHSGFF